MILLKLNALLSCELQAVMTHLGFPKDPLNENRQRVYLRHLV